MSGLQNVTILLQCPCFVDILLKNFPLALAACTFSPDQGSLANYKQFTQDVGNRNLKKYMLLLWAWSSPDVMLSAWFKGSTDRGMGEVPGKVRNAVIQRVRGIYSGWVIKVLVLSKEK